METSDLAADAGTTNATIAMDFPAESKPACSAGPVYGH